MEEPGVDRHLGRRSDVPLDPKLRTEGTALQFRALSPKGGCLLPMNLLLPALWVLLDRRGFNASYPLRRGCPRRGQTLDVPRTLCFLWLFIVLRSLSQEVGPAPEPKT